VTEERHLSADLIADLLDGSLAAAEVEPARSHLADCATCSAARDDQVFVATLLSEDAAVGIAMPSDIAIALDAAIVRASLERRDRPTEAAPATPSRWRAPWALKWLAGAAATVVVAGIGVAGWQAIDVGGSDSNTASDSAGTPTFGNLSIGGQAGSEVEHPRKSGAPSPPSFTGGPVNGVVARVTAAEVPQQARKLVANPGSRVTPQSRGCSTPIGGDTATVIQYQGHFAVLSLNLSTRTATVLDCKTAVQQLLSVGF
jgi:hypothetical protein